jgi:hypothetical protein
MNYNGWGLAEFKYCKNRKDYVFMELNAKFWASLEFFLLNKPEFAKQLFHIDIKTPPCKKILFVNQLLHLKLIHLLKGLRHIGSSKLVFREGFFYLFLLRIKNKIPHQ